MTRIPVSESASSAFICGQNPLWNGAVFNPLTNPYIENRPLLLWCRTPQL
jgi:hypothetical protein